MERFRRLPANPGQQRFTQEWDELASLRDEQKSSQRDYSYHNVLKPAVLNSLQSITQSSRAQVIDIGCGTGDLAAAISVTHDVVGIDPSPKSIAIANSSTSSLFVCSSAEEYAKDHAQEYAVAVANMVLMDCPDLRELLAAIRRLLIENGSLVATITHPWGWPQYCGYETEDWFTYSDELFIESAWRISSDIEEGLPLLSTHVHRPLGAYVDAATGTGFTLEKVVELGISATGRYGQELRFAVPKFLMLQMRAS